MIWRFGKRQLADVVKVQQFLEKEGIDYELLVDHIDVQVGEAEVAPVTPASAEYTVENAPVLKSGTRPVPVEDPDPLWRPAQHDGKVCNDKAGCKANEHYGAEPL